MVAKRRLCSVTRGLGWDERLTLSFRRAHTIFVTMVRAFIPLGLTSHLCKAKLMLSQLPSGIQTRWLTLSTEEIPHITSFLPFPQAYRMEIHADSNRLGKTGYQKTKTGFPSAAWFLQPGCLGDSFSLSQQAEADLPSQPFPELGLPSGHCLLPHSSH